MCCSFDTFEYLALKTNLEFTSHDQINYINIIIYNKWRGNYLRFNLPNQAGAHQFKIP